MLAFLNSLDGTAAIPTFWFIQAPSSYPTIVIAPRMGVVLGMNAFSRTNKQILFSQSMVI